jgi:hypothetical protein
MPPSEYIAVLTTLRGIIAVITAVALLGAGVGSLSPASDLQDPSDDATLQTQATTEPAPREPRPTETETRVTATTAEPRPTTERAFSAETDTGTRAVGEEATTTERASETTTASSDVTWDASVSDGSDRSGDPPDATVRATGNATVGDRSTNPIAVAR